MDIRGTFGLRAAQSWGRGLERAHTGKIRPAQAPTGKKPQCVTVHLNEKVETYFPVVAKEYY